MLIAFFFSVVLAILTSIAVPVLENSKGARSKLDWLLRKTVNRHHAGTEDPTPPVTPDQAGTEDPTPPVTPDQAGTEDPTPPVTPDQAGTEDPRPPVAADHAGTEHPRPPVTVDHVVTTMRKFLLTLSDQQLVTGMGICISAYVSICSTQLYDFLNGCHLALLSFAVHVLTITTLRPQFRHNRGRARVHLRLALAGLNVVLLSPIFLHIAFTDSASFSLLQAYPASCLFTGALLGSTTPKGWVIFGLVVCLAVLSCAAVTACVFLDLDGPRRHWPVVRTMPYLSGVLVTICVIVALCMTSVRVSGVWLRNLVIDGSANVWGFGQILPVSMLLLAPLALVELKLPGWLHEIRYAYNPKSVARNADHEVGPQEKNSEYRLLGEGNMETQHECFLGCEPSELRLQKPSLLNRGYNIAE